MQPRSLRSTDSSSPHHCRETPPARSLAFNEHHIPYMSDSGNLRPQIAQKSPLIALPTPNDDEGVDKAGQNDLDTCVICLDAITERAIAIPCKHHNFDFLCLISWLEEHPTCPLCKGDVKEVQYDWRAPDDFKSYSVKATATTSASAPATPSGNSGTNGNIWAGRYGRFRDRPNRHRHLQINVDEDTALQRRRYVYKHNLYSLHVGSNRVSRFRTITPAIFASDGEIQSRARSWIRRELKVFSFLNSDSSENDSSSSSAQSRASNAEFLLEYIIAILKTTEMKGANGQAEELLQEFIGRDNATLFLHELGAWLRSPFINLRDWDRNVQYQRPLLAKAEEDRSESFHRRRATSSRRRDFRHEPYSSSRRNENHQERDSYRNQTD